MELEEIILKKLFHYIIYLFDIKFLHTGIRP